MKALQGLLLITLGVILLRIAFRRPHCEVCFYSLSIEQIEHCLTMHHELKYRGGRLNEPVFIVPREQIKELRKIKTHKYENSY